MKIYNFLIFFVLINLSCDGQKNNTTYPKEIIVNTEVFDIPFYEKKKDEQLKKEMLNPWIVEMELPNKEKLELFSSTDGKKTTYLKVLTPPPPSLLKNMKRFHANGKIAVEYQTYVGILNPYPNAEYTLVGETKYFDESGLLFKIENNEKIFEGKKVNLIKLFSLLEKEPILDSLTIEDKKALQSLIFSQKDLEEITPKLLINFFQENLNKNDKENGIANNQKLNGFFLNSMNDFDRASLEISYDNNVWSAKKDFYPFGWVTLKVDAQTEKVLEKRYYSENTP